MIKVKLTSVDGTRQSKSFKTVSKARVFAVEYVGPDPEFGSTYAVSSDGIVTVTVEGCTLKELFFDAPLSKTFQIYVETVNEDNGQVSRFLVEDFATFAEAEKVYQSDKYGIYDGQFLTATTPEGKAEIEEYRKAKIAEFYVREEREEDEFGIPF